MMMMMMNRRKKRKKGEGGNTTRMRRCGKRTNNVRDIVPGGGEDGEGVGALLGVNQVFHKLPAVVVCERDRSVRLDAWHGRRAHWRDWCRHCRSVCAQVHEWIHNATRVEEEEGEGKKKGAKGTKCV